MVNGVVTGVVVAAAPPCPPKRGGGGNPTPQPREWVVAEPPPRPAVVAAPTWQPRFWPGAVTAAPADLFSSVLCRLWTSRCTLLRQEECDSEEGKADAARRTLWDMGEVNSWQENRRPPQVLAGEGEEARGHAGSCPRWRCEKTSSTTRLFGLWERDTPVDSRDDAGLVDVGEGGYRRRVLRALIYTNL
jgi:hypothetical protein